MDIIKKLIKAGQKKVKTVFEPLVHPVLLKIHKGVDFECPFCGYNSKDWSIIGSDYPVLMERKVIGGMRRPGGCWNCGSKDRHRLIFLYLREKLRLFDTEQKFKILHLAPEKNIA